VRLIAGGADFREYGWLHDEEIAKLREDMIAGFRRHDEEIARLREDMIEGFRRHDEEITSQAQGGYD
jgi:hypothetical protein